MAQLVGADQLLVETNRLADAEQGDRARRPERLFRIDAFVTRSIQLFDIGRTHRPSLDAIDPVPAADLAVDGVDECPFVVVPVPCLHDFPDRPVHLAVEHVGRIRDVRIAVRKLVRFVSVGPTRHQ